MKPSRPKTLREQYADSDKALSFHAAMAGKPPVHQRTALPEPVKRGPRKPSEIPTEHQEQVAYVKWFRQQYKGVRIFAIPNAAMRSVELASYLKAEGMVPGVPDLFVPEWLFWNEFKRVKGGIISDEQQEWADYLTRDCGHTHIFSYGCEDAIAKTRLFRMGK